MKIDKIGKQGKKHTREPQRFATFSFYLFPNEIFDIFFLYELELENLFFNRESMTFFSLHMNMNLKMYSAIGKLIRGC